MTQQSDCRYSVSVFRYDPDRGGRGHFDTYSLEVQDPANTTVLDVLLRLQETQDPTLAFRFACRVNMCGSCGMVINGREALACKTNVWGMTHDRRITLRPLNHLPVIKDLVVDLDPFFRKYEAAAAYFQPAGSETEPAVVRPDSGERMDIGNATECISCGCCVSSCTAMAHHADYLGPAALNRVFTLLRDSRDGAGLLRLEQVADSCYHCRTELNCTEVCPKDISPTRAIKFIQRMALGKGPEVADAAPGPEPMLAAPSAGPPGGPGLPRRRFLGALTVGIGGAVMAAVGGLLVKGAAAPAFRQAQRQWVRIAPLEAIPENQVSTFTVSYDRRSGFYTDTVTKAVIVHRSAAPGPITVLDPSCTHLGCLVRYDPRQQQILCACHGGKFDAQGRVTAGPPPRPLDRYAQTVEAGVLYAEMA